MTDDKVIREEWAAHTARSSRDAAKLTAVKEVCKPFIPLRSTVLLDAEKAINGDRDQAYGAPAENFTNIANLWTVLLGPKLKDGEEVSPGDVASLMIALKLARAMTSPEKTDHWVDTAGYAALAAEVNTRNP